VPCAFGVAANLIDKDRPFESSKAGCCQKAAVFAIASGLQARLPQCKIAGRAIQKNGDA